MKKQIYILDDDYDYCDQLADILEPLAEVKFFTEVDSFFHALDKKVPHLCLIDLNLNEERDGFDVIIKTKKRPDAHLIAILMISGEDSSDVLQKAFRSGIEDYVAKPILPKIFLAKVENVLYNTQSKIHTNALTGMPGISIIEEEFDLRIKQGNEFTVAYIDLDNFKPFNDEKGVKKGDDAILLLAQVLKNVRSNYSRNQLFTGHLGGDDFFLMGQKSKIRGSLKPIYHKFEEGCKKFFSEEELKAGFYTGLDRDSKSKVIPLLTLSTACLHVPIAGQTKFSDISEMASRVKKKAKNMPGNSIAEAAFITLSGNIDSQQILFSSEEATVIDLHEWKLNK